MSIVAAGDELFMPILLLAASQTKDASPAARPFASANNTRPAVSTPVPVADCSGASQLVPSKNSSDPVVLLYRVIPAVGVPGRSAVVPDGGVNPVLVPVMATLVPLSVSSEFPTAVVLVHFVSVFAVPVPVTVPVVPFSVVPDILSPVPSVIAATFPVEPRPNNCDALRDTALTLPSPVAARANTLFPGTFWIFA